MVIRRIEFLLPDFRQVASSRAIGIGLGGVRTCVFLGAATTILAICPFPDAPISPAPQTHTLGSPVWR